MTRLSSSLPTLFTVPTFFRHLAALVLGFALLAVAPRQAAAQDSGFGLGLIVGDPTGLSLKGFLSPRIALDGAVGFGILRGFHIEGHADFLWNQPLVQFDRASMALHFGVGPKIGLFTEADELWVGARGPVGLTFGFKKVPMDFFFEIAAGLWIIREPVFDLDAAVGTRYFF